MTDWYGPLTPAARTAADDVRLLVTELVAHAVRRGGAPYEFRLDRSVDGVWIQVTATVSPGPPEAVPRLVRLVAVAWGGVPRERGGTVWCEVRFPPAPEVPSRPSEAARAG
ncbi:hypothetical protein [Streptomyces filamentosus]|uniref:hypothetical protein n=1 Tax=Streptomyces filamentosus TaxID=67294 RepID=UPI0033E5076C